MPNNIREKARAKCVRVSDIVATKYRNSHGATDSVHLSTLIQSQVAPLVEQLAVAVDYSQGILEPPYWSRLARRRPREEGRGAFAAVEMSKAALALLNSDVKP